MDEEEYLLVGFCSAVQLLMRAWHGSSSTGATPRFEPFLHEHH